jgi:hypothetical protein
MWYSQASKAHPLSLESFGSSDALTEYTGVTRRGKNTHLNIGNQTSDIRDAILNIFDPGMYLNHFGFRSQDRGGLH